MMPRVHLVLARADDPGQPRAGLHLDAVCRRMPAGLLIARFYAMRIHVSHMLDQGAAVKHVEQLQAPANGQHRKIGRQSFLEQPHLKLIARVLRRLALRGSRLPVKLRIDVAASREQKSVQPFERHWIPHGFDARTFQSRLVRR